MTLTSAISLSIVTLAGVLAVGSGEPAMAALQDPPPGHPRLINEDATQCTTCHGEVVANEPIHAAAEDCSTCHEVTIGDEGTAIELMVGEPELCTMCHDDLATAVEGALATPHYPVTDSCLTCHSPHSSAEPRLLLASVGELCSSCHDVTDLNEIHGMQITAGTDCTTCHDPHGSDNEHALLAGNLHAPFEDGTCEACHREPLGDRVRLRARGERLCTACHGEFGAGDGVMVHAALKGKRGRAGCLSCHDPHMSANPTLLLSSGPPLCGGCHTEVLEVATADGAHYPASDDCLFCHQPHASEQVSLLTAGVAELCQSCHDPADDALVAAHLSADVGSLECVRCHSPHGSESRALLAGQLHPPLEDGCDTCHTGSFNEIVEDGESALCLLCHEEIGETALAASVPHAAMEFGRCADCHEPHASSQAHLVKYPAGAACTVCHEEQAPGVGEIQHGAITLLGCQGCHQPHGGERAGLLRREPTELCLDCHAIGGEGRDVDPNLETVVLLDHFEVTAAQVRRMATLRLSDDGERDHPVKNHRVLGMPTDRELKLVDTTFEDELTCLVCHDPHKGATRQLLRWGAESGMETCTHCHPK